MVLELVVLAVMAWQVQFQEVQSSEAVAVEVAFTPQITG
tara:strand:- start:186 stop:302 length:117 start_codon:yes stop_codon:yes gene_type:complete